MFLSTLLYYGILLYEVNFILWYHVWKYMFKWAKSPKMWCLHHKGVWPHRIYTEQCPLVSTCISLFRHCILPNDEKKRVWPPTTMLAAPRGVKISTSQKKTFKTVLLCIIWTRDLYLAQWPISQWVSRSLGQCQGHQKENITIIC